MFVYYSCSQNGTTEPTYVAQMTNTTRKKLVGYISRPRHKGLLTGSGQGIADPQNSRREFLKFWRELPGIYRSFVFFSNFYC